MLTFKRVLQSWKSAPTDLRTCRLKGRRFIYDKVFEDEKRADFELAWEREGRVILRIRPSEISDNDLSKRINLAGERYRLKPDSAEIWYSTDQTELIQVVVPQNLAQQLPIPSHEEFENQFGGRTGDFSSNWYRGLSEWFRSSRGFLSFPVHPGFSVFAYDIEWELTRSQSGYSHLKAKLDTGNRHLSEVLAIVDRSQGNVVALKLVDSSGNRETVYRFDEREENCQFAADDPIFDIQREKLRFISLELPR